MPDQLTHCVYFTLKEKTAENCQALVEDCYRLLTQAAGVEHLYAGLRTPDLNRPVNDGQFDVALTIVFKDRAAHDAYQTDPLHTEFINNNKEKWESIRVFDFDLNR